MRNFAWLTVLFGLATVLGWRWAPPLGIMASGATLVMTWLYAARHASGAQRLQSWFSAGAGCLAGLRIVVPTLWPCEWRCHSPQFATVFGIPLEYFALLVVAIWIPVGIWLQRWNAWFSWGVAGACGFYLGAMAALGQPCQLCLAVHTLLLGAVFLSSGNPFPWRYRVGTMVCGAMLVAALHALGAPSPPPLQPDIDPSGLAPPPRATPDRPY